MAALPRYPNEITEAGWRKATGSSFAKLEKELKVGSTLATLEEAVTGRHLKVFENMYSAVKAKEGGEIKKLYEQVSEVLDHVERLERLAIGHQKMCKSFAPDLKDDPATKKIGEWLLESGDAGVEYANDLKKFGEDLLVKAENVPTEKITDMDWDLNEWDLTHRLTRVLHIQLNSIQLPDKKPVLVSVKGKAGADAKGNATLRAEFFEAAYKAGQTPTQTLKDALESIDKRFNQGVIKGNDLPRLMAAAFDTFEAQYTNKADKAIQAIWTELQKDREEYRGYKIKIAVSIGSKVGGIGVGVASIAVAGWTGVGTVVGLLALMNKSIGLVNQLREAWLEAAAMAKGISKEMVQLQTDYARDSAAVIGGKEVGKDVLARLTNLKVTTVTSVSGRLKTYGSKLQGCNVKASDMGAEIDKVLSEADALQAKLGRAQVQLSMVKGLDIGKLVKKHDQLMAAVDKLLKTASNLKADYKTGKVSVSTWTQQLSDLEESVPEAAKKIQKWVVPLLDFAFVTDVDGVITTTGSLIREYTALATETEDDLRDANELGNLAGDVAVLVTGLIGK